MTDQPCLEVPFDEVEKWEKIEGSCARLYAAAEWGYNKGLATPPPEAPKRPTEQEVADMAEELTWKRLPQDDESIDSFLLDVVNAALERWGQK